MLSKYVIEYVDYHQPLPRLKFLIVGTYSSSSFKSPIVISHALALNLA